MHLFELEVGPEEFMKELFCINACVLYKHGLSRPLLTQLFRELFSTLTIPVFPGRHACLLLYFPLWLDLLKFWISDGRSQMGQLSSAVKKCVPFGCFIRTAGPCMSQIVPPSLLSGMPSTLPCLPSVGGHWTQLQTPRILPQTMVSRPPPPFFLHYNESYLCGLPIRSLPPSKLSMAAGKVFECHSVHVVICLCVQWSPFCLGCSSYPLCLAIAYLPTSGSALRNISRGSLQLVRLSAKHARSILYFLALIIIIIEYLYNCWFDAGFSHSLVNSLRAGIMPAWLNSLPSASHNKYLPTECIMNGLDRSCGICYVYLYLCLKIGYLMF